MINRNLSIQLEEVFKVYNNDYANKILNLLDQNLKGLNVNEIASRLKISQPYCSLMLNKLKKHNLVIVVSNKTKRLHTINKSTVERIDKFSEMWNNYVK